MKLPWKKIGLSLGISLLILGSLITAFYYSLQPQAGRTNILVLGVAGEDYKGSDLTDSIIFFSVENETGESLLLSLPRDIWIASLRTKLNSVYHYQGIEETKKALSDILGQEIDYSVIIDFDVFVQVVDLLGGVEVEVERAFDDYRYPIAGKENDLCDGDPEFNCRYEHLHFDQGEQLMDGQTALKYVRSRNAEGEEGTDFARSQRQQKVLLAIKKKMLTPQFILNFPKMAKLVALLNENIKTDVSRDDYGELFKIALKIRKNKMETAVLNDGYLINPPTSEEKYDNQWVLVPQSGSWEEVHTYVEGLLAD
jgi:LCP family protein required for cell wall assembly